MRLPFHLVVVRLFFLLFMFLLLLFCFDFWNQGTRGGEICHFLRFERPSAESTDVFSNWEIDTELSQSEQAAANKRREQVRKSQRYRHSSSFYVPFPCKNPNQISNSWLFHRTHRQRTQSYIKELEKEVLRLRTCKSNALARVESLEFRVETLPHSIQAKHRSATLRGRASSVELLLRPARTLLTWLWGRRTICRRRISISVSPLLFLLLLLLLFLLRRRKLRRLEVWCRMRRRG